MRQVRPPGGMLLSSHHMPVAGCAVQDLLEVEGSMSDLCGCFFDKADFAAMVAGAVQPRVHYCAAAAGLVHCGPACGR
jgi:hypothetical protein